jgi:hypothetical protein
MSGSDRGDKGAAKMQEGAYRSSFPTLMAGNVDDNRSLQK